MTESKSDALTPFEGKFTVDPSGSIHVGGRRLIVAIDWWIVATAIAGVVVSLFSLIVSVLTGLEDIKSNIGQPQKSPKVLHVNVNEKVCRQVISEVRCGSRVTRTIEDLPCEYKTTTFTLPAN